ncbi:MAG TPA: putative toxin-antitoxin system toxin component, PIN family [Thauera sp.]|jgi:putative PIN family toxin of toxin-antitoxin system|nr:putative toxin-antitoxin system toxin component, PIN family [Thauera sp.]
MRPRLVLDTNTILALWMFRDPRLLSLRDWIESGACTLAAREDALTELCHVLAYPQFKLEELSRQTLLEGYRARIDHWSAEASAQALALPACRDTDDQKFLETALDTSASALITRDKALLRLARHRLVRDDFAILTPERFLSQLPAP